MSSRGLAGSLSLTAEDGVFGSILLFLETYIELCMVLAFRFDQFHLESHTVAGDCNLRLFVI